ncbi:Peptidyl-tRNA hydrolase ICT1, mitochondrial [Portunus trituberculatus]|uniref:Large ribosomal subunit protein mL62 n=1 Tax=Portunus trituberculatus TaxID=210409 RepID=A0A5B7DLJ7_PORTR|nr:Peptidyl-tRNA hydrolase ICT1, mitochondrial [Portunus trituberculatus]
MLRSCPGISRSLGRTVASCRSLHTSAGAWNYKSNVNLHNIYPQSDLDITKPQENTFTNWIDTDVNSYSSCLMFPDKVQLTYSRSSGPGGQNVNRINTKVDLRFHLASAEWLSPELKEKLATKHKTSITSNGFLVIRSDKTRSQQLNVAEAMDKLRHLIYTAAFVPPPPAAEDIERARRR